MSAFESLFKKPAIPPSNTKKRKLEPPIESPNDRYKANRVELNGKGKARNAAVEDAPDDDVDMDTNEDFTAEADEDLEDEEGGRFFGGGITQREKEILDFMEDEEDQGPEKIDLPYLRKLALNFEKKISKNAEMRAKFEDDPSKFMESEAELDVEVKNLAILAEHPELYEEFANMGCLGSLVGLLSHENTDIAIAVVQIIGELTDDEVEADPEQWNVLVNTMIDAQLLDMLTQNLERLKEKDNDEDRNGIYHTLSVFENLASNQTVSERVVKETKVLGWLLERIKVKESPVSQNKQYAAEILSILVQSSAQNRKRLIEIDGVDVLLQLLSPYRKRDPTKGAEEEELFENMFDTLICLVDEKEGKEKLVEAEGVELCLIMIREGKMSKGRALRLVDHACSGLYGGVVCEQLVEAQGLKTLFGSFMKKQDAQVTEHLLGIFASLLRNLPADSAPRIRTLAKFVEKDYEKLVKIMSLRDDYSRRVSGADREIAAERQQATEEEIEEREDEWDLRRLDAGLFCFQILDQVVSWLVAEDDGARKRATELLEKSNKSLEDVKATLVEQLDGLDESTEEGKGTKEMLTALVSCL
ncbi:hypothetical protein TWF225_002366 [Orbilia oligospora]|uniref:Uncharacterized protein n=1 Tax=Orbilia oligospora TaxID=2813651 RepID=A0A7C8K6F6_ORBOL|nr:hypothetical protein TWF751_003894 [Orbilia oligospora]KAF3162843.1 hypothetical protein TWF225_002366 [Orbilia oligospora]KAF3244781.1 hypothetical protein TWF217_010624 [Orbilia oligospora]KAF3260114.1 hypothetical protein TWF128_003593 [Orbilia oligospora]KAF3276425.1 hypothetical protein TWF132_002237 [Orbilia oligospora]